jgi:threonine/homoserine/homoserine lactone efflux protein
VTPDQVLAFVLFAFVAAITPGPSNVVLASVGANIGVRRGVSTLCGVVTGMGLMIVLVALGLGSILVQ